jgi:hypothetical protein
MRYLRLPGRVSAVFTWGAAFAAAASGQVKAPNESIGGPLTGPPVSGAPFSADATTIVQAILGDGTRLAQSTTDRYYRDSAGRVRVERQMDGMPAPLTISERHMRTIIDPDPSDALFSRLMRRRGQRGTSRAPSSGAQQVAAAGFRSPSVESGS